MSITEKKESPQERYDRQNRVIIAMNLNRKTDSDILEAVEGKAKQTELKRLIRLGLGQESEANSGNAVTLTLPKTLHKELSEAAEKESVSLEQYILYKLSQ